MKYKDIGQHDLLLIQGDDKWRKMNFPTAPCYIEVCDIKSVKRDSKGNNFTGTVRVGSLNRWQNYFPFCETYPLSHNFAIIAVKHFVSLEERNTFMLTHVESRGQDIQWDWELCFDNRYRKFWSQIYPYREWRDTQ